MSRPFVVILAVLLSSAGSLYAASTGTVEIRVVDAETGELIPCRMHLKDQAGKPVKVPQTIYWHDHFVVPGKVGLSLKPGVYTFEMQRGAEYKIRTGNFIIERNATDSKTVEMVRFVNMASEGWYAGDLNVQRPLEDLPLLLASEELSVAPVVTWSNTTNRWRKEALPTEPLIKLEGNRFYHLLAGEDRRAGGPLLFLNLAEPLTLPENSPEVPSGAQLIAQAKGEGSAAHVAAALPFAWDFPLWLATGQLDSVAVCHSYLQPAAITAIGKTGKPFPKSEYPPAVALGRWSQEIYFHALNCGLRLPPSAGSGSGVAPNPIGYDRLYVHCGDDFSYENWFANLQAGRVVVTNGPLIRPRVNDQLPGHVFTAAQGEKITLSMTLNLSLRDKVDYLEIIRDGEVLHEIRLDKFAAANGKLPPVTFDASGWLLVRAVANHAQTYRFAMSAPWYVEIGYQPRISKTSAQFFHDWLYERVRQIDIADAEQRDAVLQYHRAARDFWQKKLAAANAR